MTVKRVGIVGSGIMGSGIAEVAGKAGFEVSLRSRQQNTADRMMAGLETVTAGTIKIGDRDVTALPPQQRDIAMVFQNYALYPHMTVYNNMAFGLKLRRIPRAEISQKVRAAAKIELVEFRHRPFGCVVRGHLDEGEATCAPRLRRSTKPKPPGVGSRCTCTSSRTRSTSQTSRTPARA